jgi:hypothetical protein
MWEAASVSTSLDFSPARPAFKRLKFVCAAVERMRGAPSNVHHLEAGRTNRPVMGTKPDLHKHDIDSPAPFEFGRFAGAASTLHGA